jgi:hypothetical protein
MGTSLPRTFQQFRLERNDDSNEVRTSHNLVGVDWWIPKFVVWLLGWLVTWLARWLIGWLVGWKVGKLVVW